LPQHSILWFCNIRVVKRQISIFDMYIPCKASSWTLFHQNRKLECMRRFASFVNCFLQNWYIDTFKHKTDKTLSTFRRCKDSRERGNGDFLPILSSRLIKETFCRSAVKFPSSLVKRLLRIDVETRLKGYKYFEIERFFLINLVSWLMGILNLVYYC
jgi:hypothetical protein